MKQRLGFGPKYVPVAGPPGSEAMIRSRRLTKESKYYGIKVNFDFVIWSMASEAFGFGTGVDLTCLLWARRGPLTTRAYNKR